MSDARAVALVIERGSCVGARVHVGSRVIEARASATLLATGGAGRVFRETTNPSVATGDGVALAWEAGAAIADMEFVQFHPTVMAVPGTPRFLLSEALRGDGAWLLNVHGERFMPRVEPAGELASRDLVARAIVREELRTGAPVTLSLRHLDPDWVRRRFPTLVAACRDRGLDLATDLVPVSPAAHYVMGGVASDIDGRTTVPGLYAAGEVACTGVHGANRLASNSLLEGLVFGARAAEAMQAPPRAGLIARPRTRGRMPQAPAPTVVPALDAVRELMWRDVGLVRDGAGLGRAVVTLDGWRRAVLAAGRGDGDATGALVTVAWLMARGALDRCESRGGHARSDFPARDDLHWMVHVSESAHDQDS
jgi:L-aspartate oxidase